MSGRDRGSECTSSGPQPVEAVVRPKIVIGIGLAAGGLKPLRTLLSRLPAGRGLAVIVVQHLEAGSEALPVSLIADQVRLKVMEAVDGSPISPECVYVMPAGMSLCVHDGRLTVHDVPHCRGLRLPIDHFLCTLAADQGPRAAGIILSGAGADGAQGLAEIKALGGVTAVQAPETAEVPDMPQNAIATGCADASLPPEHMAAFLIRRLEELAAPTAERAQVGVDDESSRLTVGQLEDELKITREELQSTIKQLEQSNRHLKASNEQLSAVNQRLQEKIIELEQASNDVAELRELAEALRRSGDSARRRLTETETEITERKRAEEALRDAHDHAAWLARFPDENPSPVLRASAEGTILYCNPVAAELPGWECKAGQLLPPPLGRLVGQALAAGEQVQTDVELGGRVYAVSVAPFPNECYANLYASDITDRRQAEEALCQLNINLEERVAQQMREIRQTHQAVQAERQRLYDVLETLPVYVVLLTPDYHVPFANRFFRERFGESHGKRCFEYLFSRTEPCENCDTYTVLKTNGPHRWEWTGPDGRNYDIYDFPFKDADGSTLILEMGIDITDRRRAEAGLQELNATLERRVADRAAEIESRNEQIQRQIEALRQANEDLERFNRVAVGRELRMIELKKEINELCARLGRPPAYSRESQEEQA